MTDDQEQELDEIIAQYLQAQEGDETISAEDVIAAHPEFADQLREFFDDLGQMDALARPVPHPVDSQPPVLEKIRYFGDYELLEEIARGGMGIIYRGRQVSLNRPVAVKMILTGNLASESDVRRFWTEAQSAAELDHSNIVPIYEIGEHEGQNYFSMKLIEGCNLAEHSAKLPADQEQIENAIRMMIPICRAVNHAHQRGILHRDLKPSNILIDSDGTPHVTDFGLAKRTRDAEDLTISGAIIGTPGYMPPEQAAGKKSHVTTQSDIYGLGGILYRMLTGQAPHKGDSVADTLRLIQEGEVSSLRTLNPAIDRDLEAICLKCLCKTPEERYETAEELAIDLEKWISGDPLSVRPLGTGELIRRWFRRTAKTVPWVVFVTLFFGLWGALTLESPALEQLIGNSARTLTETGRSPYSPHMPETLIGFFKFISSLPETARWTFMCAGILGLGSIGLLNSLIVRPRNVFGDLRLALYTGILLGLILFIVQAPLAISSSVIVPQIVETRDLARLAEGQYQDFPGNEVPNDSIQLQQNQIEATQLESAARALQDNGQVDMLHYPALTKHVARSFQEIEFEKRFPDMKSIEPGQRGNMKFSQLVAIQVIGIIAGLIITFPRALLTGCFIILIEIVLARVALKLATSRKKLFGHYYEQFLAFTIPILCLAISDRSGSPVSSIKVLMATLFGIGLVICYSRMVAIFPPIIRIAIYVSILASPAILNHLLSAAEIFLLYGATIPAVFYYLFARKTASAAPDTSASDSTI